MILETKLTLPQPKAGALLRTGLIELIKNNLDKKLILITAGAGYGKTTLLGQLVKEARMPAVFYSMDENDSELAVFYSYLVRGLEQLDAALAERCRGLVQQGGAALRDYELLMGTLINELAEKRKQELFIILDDYQQLAENSPVHRAVEYFIEHQPQMIHVVISSRARPRFFKQAKWTAKADLLAVGRAEMAFNAGDLEALAANAYRRILTAPEADELLLRTEGWITGIQLVLKTAAGPDANAAIGEIMARFLSSDQPIFEYFSDEIFRNEKQPVRDFMIKTAELDFFTPELCDSILGTADSGNVLKSLERRNLFLFRTMSGGYCYHRLFRMFLRDQIKDDGIRKEIHLKAAAYFREKGDKEAAVENYLRAGEYALSGGLIIQIAPAMMQQARLTTVKGWLDCLPEKIIDDDYRLLFVRAETCREHGDIQQMETACDKIEKLIKCPTGKRGKKESLTALLRCRLMRGQMLYRACRYDEARSVIAAALRLCPKGQVDIRASFYNLLGILWDVNGEFEKSQRCYAMAVRIGKNSENRQANIGTCNLANTLIRYGRCKQGYYIFKRLFSEMKPAFTIMNGAIYANIAKAAIYNGDLEYAKNTLNAGWEIYKSYEDHVSRAALHNSFGLLYIYQGRWGLAREHLDKAFSLFAQVKWKTGRMMALYCSSILFRCQGDFEASYQCLEKAIGEENDTSSINWVMMQAQLALACTAGGRFEQAQKTIDAIGRLTGKYHLRLESFYALLALSAIRLHQGQKAAAARQMIKAVRASAEFGYRGILQNELRHDRNLAELVYEYSTRGRNARLFRGLLIGTAGSGLRQLDFEVNLFGNLSISLPAGGALLLNWKSRKEASLLAYLIVHRNRVCFREELMKAFWPHADLKHAEQSLYTWVFQLKKDFARGLRACGRTDAAAHPVIIHREHGYQVNPDYNFQVDAEEFMKSWELFKLDARSNNGSQAASHLEKCLALYRDRYLIDLSEQWCEALREKHEMIYLEALLAMARHHTDHQAFDQAAGLYKIFIEHEQYLLEIREDVHQLYWKTLKASGKASGIKDDYKNMVRTLRKEFGAMPKPETKKIFEQLVSQ